MEEKLNAIISKYTFENSGTAAGMGRLLQQVEDFTKEYYAVFVVEKNNLLNKVSIDAEREELNKIYCLTYEEAHGSKFAVIDRSLLKLDRRPQLGNRQV